MASLVICTVTLCIFEIHGLDILHMKMQKITVLAHEMFLFIQRLKSSLI